MADWQYSRNQREEFLAAYVECATWSSTVYGDDGEPTDKQFDALPIVREALSQIDAFSEEAADKMREDAKDFMDANMEDLTTAYDLHKYQPSQAGHDFWLTRNRHGAGFWDRGLGEIGERLTKNAHPYGEADLYLGDDGKIEVQ